MAFRFGLFRASNNRLDDSSIPITAIQIPNVRSAANASRTWTDKMLGDAAERLRESLARSDEFAIHDIEQIFGLTQEALRRTLNVELYDVQLIAASILAGGKVAEMQTGEGKTISAAPATVLHGLTGRGVHIVNPNSYLANRDFRLLRSTYELLGLSVGILADQSTEREKQIAYEADITFGTGYDFGFDYLRDQIALRRTSEEYLGRSIQSQLRNWHACSRPGIQRSRSLAIIDEIDHVLIDDAGSPLILSTFDNSEAADSLVYRQARRLVTQMDPSLHFRRSGDRIELTPQGREFSFADDGAIPVKLLRRPWMEYVEHTLQAAHLFRRNVHYVVDNGFIRIVDASTGRIFSDRSWQEGLHQAIEAKEQLSISSEKHILAQITRQRFFRIYDRLSGMTGTATDCEREFRQVYELQVVPVPLRVASRRQMRPVRCFADADAKWNAIVADVESLNRAGRPILVGTRSIADSDRLADKLRRRGVAFDLLNGLQDAEEAEIVSRAGQPGAVTLATNLAGRGTDIQLGPGVPALGGLHVILAEPQECARADRQMIGRCARQGDPGSAQIFISADDNLIQDFGPWLAKPIRAAANRSGEALMILTGRIARLQRRAERAQFASRSALLRQDLARDSLLSRIGDER